eukprot:TRINITY_DN11740_c0_g1_i1.p1 TRINITY_DN11740_c0_g1~~TRINITY_DN11740_c0_g1_i1.p1  ORF type:complete len:307 (+),score=57.75 TRINITY_DN11740_c0_g1_i1:43-963(+)
MPKLLTQTKSVPDTHTDGVMCLCASVNAEGKSIIYSGGMDGIIKVWTDEGEELQKFEAHSETVNKLIAKDGKLYSCSDDAKIKVWDCAETKNTATMTHDDGINNMFIDGEILYSCDDTGTVKIHSLTDYTTKCTFPGAAEALNCLAVYKELLWTGGDDGFLRLWNIAPGSLTDGQMVPADNIYVLESEDTVMINNCLLQDSYLWVSVGVTNHSCVQRRCASTGELLAAIQVNDWPRTIVITEMFYFVACDDGKIYGWVMGGDDKNTPSALSQASEDGTEPIMDMVFCGKKAASTSDSSINFWSSLV